MCVVCVVCDVCVMCGVGGVCVVCVCVWCMRVAIELIGIFMRAGLYWGPKGVKKGSELIPNGAQMAPRGGPGSSTFALGAC